MPVHTVGCLGLLEGIPILGACSPAFGQDQAQCERTFPRDTCALGPLWGIPTLVPARPTGGWDRTLRTCDPPWPLCSLGCCEEFLFQVLLLIMGQPYMCFLHSTTAMPWQ